MSRTVCVSGASDDLVEVDGDVSLEFGCYGADAVVVDVNGVPLLEVTYGDEGLWRITQIGEVPGVWVELFPTPGEDEPRDPAPPFSVASYSDYVMLRGEIARVSVGDEHGSA